MSMREICDSRLLLQGVTLSWDQVQKKLEAPLYSHQNPSNRGEKTHQPHLEGPLQGIFQELQKYCNRKGK